MHITVNGTPWCEACSRRSTWKTDSLEEMGGRHVELMQAQRKHNALVICMNSYPNDQAAVDLLRSLGVDAELAEGDCPTLDQP